MSDLVEKDEILSVQHDEDFQIENVDEYENILVHLDNISFKIQKELIKLNPLSILYFKETSDDIKKIAIEQCDDQTIEYISTCMYFNKLLYKQFCEKAKEFNYNNIPTLKQINNNLENNIPKLRVAEVNEETNESLKYPYLVTNTNKSKWIDANPLSLIRVHKPSKVLCKTAIDNCKKIITLNRIIFSIDLKKYDDLYLLYTQKNKRLFDE